MTRQKTGRIEIERKTERDKETSIVAATLTYESVLNKTQLSPSGVAFVEQEDKRKKMTTKGHHRRIVLGKF